MDEDYHLMTKKKASAEGRRKGGDAIDSLSHHDTALDDKKEGQRRGSAKGGRRYRQSYNSLTLVV